MGRFARRDAQFAQRELPGKEWEAAKDGPVVDQQGRVVFRGDGEGPTGRWSQRGAQRAHERGQIDDDTWQNIQAQYAARSQGGRFADIMRIRRQVLGAQEQQRQMDQVFETSQAFNSFGPRRESEEDLTIEDEPISDGGSISEQFSLGLREIAPPEMPTPQTTPSATPTPNDDLDLDFSPVSPQYSAPTLTD